MECFMGICHLHCTIVCLFNENNRKIKDLQESAEILSYSMSQVYDFLTEVFFLFWGFLPEGTLWYILTTKSAA